MKSLFPVFHEEENIEHEKLCFQFYQKLDHNHNLPTSRLCQFFNCVTKYSDFIRIYNVTWISEARAGIPLHAAGVK